MTMKLFILAIFITFGYAEFEEEQLDRLISYHSCGRDIDCKINSFCFDNDVSGKRGNCKCLDGYILNRNRSFYECLEGVDGVNSQCTRDIQCQYTLGSLSGCVEPSMLCQCHDGAHLTNNNKCYKTVALGEICDTNFNCRLSSGDYGLCVAGHCSCNAKHHPADNGQYCVKSVNLGDACPNDESCKHTAAVCRGVCTCMAGFVESQNSYQCLNAAHTFGDNCTENIQCSRYLEDSFCYNATCRCNSGFHGFGNQCVRDAKLGDYCTDKKQCVLNADLEYSVDCVAGICACLEGVSDENSYGCVIVSGTKSVLPINLFIIFALFVGFCVS